MCADTANRTPHLYAVRGATTLGGNDVETYRLELIRLVKTLTESNHITPEQIVTAFFTVTHDLTCTNPAKVVREGLGWNTVPMICAVEPAVEGFPPYCIRVLIQFYPIQNNQPIIPVYHNGAKALRPDLT